MERRQLFAAAAALCLMAAGWGASAPLLRAAGSSPAGATGSNLLRVTMAYSEIFPGNIPVWTTYEAGLFRKHGLDVDLRLIASTNAINALLGGDVQFATGGGAAVLNANAGDPDQPLVVIAGQVNTMAYELMAAKGIDKPADLKGKIVGVSRFGSSSDTATRYVLKRLGLDPSRDVTLIQSGSLTNRVAALRSGQIHAIVVNPPEDVRLEQVGTGIHVLYDLARDRVPDPNDEVITTRAFIAQHAQAVQAFAGALVEGVKYAKGHRAFTEQVFARYLKLADKSLLAASYRYWIEGVVPDPPVPTLEGFKRVQAELAATRPKVRDVDLARTVDAHYVLQAAEHQ